MASLDILGLVAAVDIARGDVVVGIGRRRVPAEDVDEQCIGC
jgi:hypothetical protein